MSTATKQPSNVALGAIRWAWSIDPSVSWSLCHACYTQENGRSVALCGATFSTEPFFEAAKEVNRGTSHNYCISCVYTFRCMEAAAEAEPLPRNSAEADDLDHVFLRGDWPEQMDIAPDQLIDGEMQPRSGMDQAGLAELGANMQRYGQLDAIICYIDRSGRPAILAGHRRTAAAKLVGLPTVRIVIRELSLRDIMAQALVSNTQREQLSVGDFGRHCQRIIQLRGISEETLAGEIGCSRSKITQARLVANAAPAVQAALDAGKLSFTQVRGLLHGAGKDHETQQAALVSALRIVGVGNHLSESSARETGAFAAFVVAKRQLKALGWQVDEYANNFVVYTDHVRPTEVKHEALIAHVAKAAAPVDGPAMPHASLPPEVWGRLSLMDYHIGTEHGPWRSVSGGPDKLQKVYLHGDEIAAIYAKVQPVADALLADVRARGWNIQLHAGSIPDLKQPDGRSAITIYPIKRKEFEAELAKVLKLPVLADGETAPSPPRPKPSTPVGSPWGNSPWTEEASRAFCAAHNWTLEPGAPGNWKASPPAGQIPAHNGPLAVIMPTVEHQVRAHIRAWLADHGWELHDETAKKIGWTATPIGSPLEAGITIPTLDWVIPAVSTTLGLEQPAARRLAEEQIALLKSDVEIFLANHNWELLEREPNGMWTAVPAGGCKEDGVCGPLDQIISMVGAVFGDVDTEPQPDTPAPAPDDEPTVSAKLLHTLAEQKFFGVLASLDELARSLPSRTSAQPTPDDYNIGVDLFRGHITAIQASIKTIVAHVVAEQRLEQAQAEADHAA